MRSFRSPLRGFGSPLGFLTGLLATILERQPDGTVLVTQLGSTWTPILTREPDGTVTVTGA